MFCYLQPAQLLRVQLAHAEPPDSSELEEPRFDPPLVANTESALRQLRPPQEGHFISVVSAERTSSSKRVLQSAQSYS